LPIETDFVIDCPDLSEALEFFTERLGFDLSMIMPADSPRVAVVSKNGASIRLEQKGWYGAEPQLDRSEPANHGGLSPNADTNIVVRRLDEGGWSTGRAGMEYRDMIPGRFGGRVAASHIRLTRGGSVPDYVHYHKIAFQVIYCLRGGIRVVYEDQGEPFWLRPGDCVLQPPEIRHHVLECEANSEVIEVGLPAVHETWVDKALNLPNCKDPQDREFSGQKFVRFVAAQSVCQPFPETSITALDTGIFDATLGAANVRVFNGLAVGATHRVTGPADLQFYFALRGKSAVTFDADNICVIRPGDSIAVTEASSLLLKMDQGSELLEVSIGTFS
jgi:quercetin dioxygenase-like cupin family protein